MRLAHPSLLWEADIVQILQRGRNTCDSLDLRPQIGLPSAGNVRTCLVLLETGLGQPTITTATSPQMLARYSRNRARLYKAKMNATTATVALDDFRSRPTQTHPKRPIWTRNNTTAPLSPLVSTPSVAFLKGRLRACLHLSSRKRNASSPLSSSTKRRAKRLR